MKWLNARPHPGPLPQERGQSIAGSDYSSHSRASADYQFAKKRRRILPLPGGEGRGEDERNHKNLGFVRRCVVLLAMAWMTAATALAQTNPITLHMIGDSTMANKPVIPANPERGWGQMLHMYFKDSVRVENYAQNGRSTKSFINEGRWDKVGAAIQPGDFVIIQFGHNDEKTNNVKVGTAPFGEFTENLTRFVRESRQHRATPILATPVARRKFDESGTLTNSHGVYPEAVRKVAMAEKVPLLELCTATEKLLQQLGPESSKRLFDWIPPGEFAGRPNGLEDDTHFNAYGASRVCDLAVVELEAKVPELAAHLKGSSARAKPVQSALEK
jgi:lysophospholipase L1-like esterase